MILREMGARDTGVMRMIMPTLNCRHMSPRASLRPGRKLQKLHQNSTIVHCEATTNEPEMSARAAANAQTKKLIDRLQEHKIGAAIVGIVAVVIRVLKSAIPKEMQVASGSSLGGAAKTFRMAAMVAPFASMGIGGTGFLVTKAVGSFLQTYLLLLFLRVLLSWFPAFNWERQPWLTLRQMTDPYLQLFRGLIPPLLGMIDFTPLLGFFILQWASGKLASATMEDSVEAFW